MARYFTSQGVTSVTVEGARTGLTREIKADGKGFFLAESKADRKALEQSGFVQASLMGTKNRGGFTCQQCGFGSWFRKCSRCGAEN